MTVIHAIGPNFNNGTLQASAYTDKPVEYYKGVKDAVERLAETYENIFSEYFFHLGTNATAKLRLLPVSSNIFAGPFKDVKKKKINKPNHMPIITYLAIVKAIKNSVEEIRNRIQNADVKLYIFDESGDPVEHEKNVNLYKLAFGFPMDEFGGKEVTHPTPDEIRDYATIIIFCNIANYPYFKGTYNITEEDDPEKYNKNKNVVDWAFESEKALAHMLDRLRKFDKYIEEPETDLISDEDTEEDQLKRLNDIMEHDSRQKKRPDGSTATPTYIPANNSGSGILGPIVVPGPAARL
jgi:hypothetical protein